MRWRSIRWRSPTWRLLAGLLLSLAAVGGFAYQVHVRIDRLRELQSELIDRNRRDTLQLLRVQNNLNQLGLAMHDMLDGAQPYPLTAWTTQFTRIRGDLDDALAQEAALALAEPAPVDRQRLTDSLSQFWDAVDRMFVTAREGRPDEAREQIRWSLQARRASLTTAVARMLFANNEREEEAAARVQDIYDQVEREAVGFLAATLAAIAVTGLVVMRTTGRLFGEVEQLSERRRELARQLITTREATLSHVARELHDEVGQILTALGTVIGRAGRETSLPQSLRDDLHDIGTTAQRTLDDVRSLSQTLHPAVLDDLGLDSALEWYVSTLERQQRLAVDYARSGPPLDVDASVGIHVYRVLQEALHNVIRHAGVDRATVRLRVTAEQLELVVEDRGVGLQPAARPGLGLTAMRERADLVGGTLDVEPVNGGGTRVRLRVPLEEDGAP